ncbi:MAG: hypothetical protein MUC79_13450 [Thiobacillaceae bacterium]|jgi:hypothetical protein|nr:hypothetical protein [Thiobacillaceae bacterium]
MSSLLYRVIKPLRYARAIQPPGAEIALAPAEASALLRAGLIAPLLPPPPASPARRARATTPAA